MTISPKPWWSNFKARKPAFALLALAACLVSYMKWVEPIWYRVQVVSIPLEATQPTSKRIRIVHLSDLHYSSAVSLEYLTKAFREAARQKPDAICLTGDYITDLLRDGDGYANALRILSDAAPTFACAGNHDGGLWARKRGGYPDVDEVRKLMERSGIVFLENEARSLRVGGTSVLIGGAGDMWAGRLDPDSIRERMNAEIADFKILLSHNPDSKVQFRGIHWDMLLCGHTHGGQLALPVIGTPFAPINDKRFVNGLYEYNGGRLYVTPGIGNLHGMRFNCRPEISVLELSR